MNGKKTALSFAIGSAFAVSLAGTPVANAAENPFGMSALKSGYLLADATDAKPMEAKPVEGKCGGKKDEKAKDGKCGGKKDAKAKDAKCGGAMKKDAAAGKMKDGKCGNKAKMKDGKCGEGKCGGKKADDKAAAPAPAETK